MMDICLSLVIPVIEPLPPIHVHHIYNDLDFLTLIQKQDIADQVRDDVGNDYCP